MARPKSAFGTWLTNELDRMNIDGATFAGRIGVSYNTYYRWTVRIAPSVASCEDIARELGHSINTVLFHAGHLQTPPASPLRDSIHAIIERLPEPLLVTLKPMLIGLRGSGPDQRAALMAELASSLEQHLPGSVRKTHD